MLAFLIVAALLLSSVSHYVQCECHLSIWKGISTQPSQHWLYPQTKIIMLNFHILYIIRHINRLAIISECLLSLNKVCMMVMVSCYCYFVLFDWIQRNTLFSQNQAQSKRQLNSLGVGLWACPLPLLWLAAREKYNIIGRSVFLAEVKVVLNNGQSHQFLSSPLKTARKGERQRSAEKVHFYEQW